jgi:hypothetical protein
VNLDLLDQAALSAPGGGAGSGGEAGVKHLSEQSGDYA